MTLTNPSISTQVPIQDVHARLESLYIQEYLRANGHSPATLEAISHPERKRIMTDASTYASTHLAWCESRARLVGELRGADR